MSVRTLARLATLAAAAGALAACSSDATGPVPSGRALARPSSSIAGGAPAGLVSNKIKYREQTHVHATGRSGSVSLTARALLGKNAVTTLDVTTGQLDAAGAPGNISRLQVKLLSAPAGATKAAMTYDNPSAGGTVSYSYPGLVRGNTIQVQANVRGIDGNRTDVATVAEQVLLRPDIAVVELLAPAEARLNTPVMIQATVKELNGDVGARADCVLSVDGAPVDRATGIWVANGDAVACTFSTSFSTAGTHALSVSAGNVMPGDWDLANNTRPASITVVSAETEMHGSAQFSDYAVEEENVSFGWFLYAAGHGAEWSTQRSGTNHSQSFMLYASAVGEASFPLVRAQANFAVGSATVLAADLGNVAGYDFFDFSGERLGTCALMLQGHVTFQLCAMGGFTFVYAAADAWEANYVASGYSHYWGPGYDNTYYSEPTSHTAGTFAPLSSTATATVRIDGGQNVFVAGGTFPLTATAGGSDLPLTCYDYNDVSFAQHGCYRSRTAWTWTVGSLEF